MYCSADNGACVKVPSNASLAHCKVCSIWLGKFFRVQMGIDFSGGSYEKDKKNDEKLENACQKTFEDFFYEPGKNCKIL